MIHSGNEDAMIKYTNMLLEGDGIDQDKSKAACILKAYADCNNIYAIDKYSNMLLNGDGIDSDSNEAAKYMAKKKNLLTSNVSFNSDQYFENEVFSKKKWFEAIFGFEENARYMKQCIEIIEYDDHVELKSKINSKTYNAGMFHIRSSSRNCYKLAKKDKQGTLNIIKGYGQYSKHFELVDILSMQSLSKWNGATYLIASNFNCLEFTNSNQTAADGVTNYYEYDTQGSNAALSCCPALVYRNYFKNIYKEINLLEKTPIWVLHGFATIPNDKYLMKSNSTFNWDNPNVWQVGVHSNCEVVITRGNDSSYREATKNQIANHVYASAFNFRRNVKLTYLTKEIAKKLLTAEYRAAILSAWENSIKYAGLEGSNKLSLTLLGGGVFGNPYKIICDAIRDNIELIVESGLDVYITCFREDDFLEIEEFIINDVYGTNGRVIDTNDDMDCKDLI